MEGAPKTPSQNESLKEQEDFVFDGEMLKTAEGRKKTFREMVRMYNAVRNKRDSLGFEKNTQVRDEDFDGYVAFRIRYFKLRKRIAELSEKGVAHTPDGTPNGYNESIDVEGPIAKEFERGFLYLKKYYDRTTSFNQTEVLPDAPAEEEPSSSEEEWVQSDEDTDLAQDIRSAIDQSQEQSKDTQDIDDLNWMGLSKAIQDREKEPVKGETTPEEPDDFDEIVAMGEEYAKHLKGEQRTTEVAPENKEKKETVTDADWDALWEEKPVEGEVVPQKAYEKRNELRSLWKEKKEAYEEAYAEYLTDRQNGGVLKKTLSYFKKEQQPESLVQLENEYLASRQQYASLLDDAFIKRLRVKEDVSSEYKQERGVSIRAGLAHRFVIKAAHEKLRLEEQYVPNSAALRTLDKMQETFKKNKKIVRTVGFAATAGIGLATGGLSAAILALGGRFVAAKFAFAGGTVGAIAAGKLYDAAILDGRERKKDTAFALTQKTFSVERIGELETLYFDRYKSYESAYKKKKYAVLGGALAGSAVGASVGGDFSFDTPETPEATPSVPPEDIQPQDIPQDRGPVVVEELPETDFIPPVPPLEIPLGEDPQQVEVDEIPGALGVEVLPVTPEVVPPVIIEAPALPQAESEGIADIEVPPVPFVFEAGSEVDTVSEALFETWKENPELSDEPLTRREFLAEMYTAIAELERQPGAYAQLMEDMGISSGDIDEVRVGQEIDLRPFYEYMNNR